MKKDIICLILLVLPTSLLAQVDQSEFATCAVIDGDLARLECYDSLATESGLAGPQQVTTAVNGVEKWSVDIKTNPIDDSTTVTLILRADSGQSRFGQPIALVARCRSNSTDLYINWQDYLGSEASVLARVGSGQAVTSRWSLSTDKQASFHPSPINFLKELIEADRLVAQVTPYNESPVTAIFNLSGIQNAIKPLRETCSW
tara:strand:- start:915 stop:1520 length:606 start_codon:yes stop_codon:yes gene_type:complete